MSLEVFAERLREAGGTVSIHEGLSEAVSYILDKLGGKTILAVKTPPEAARILEDGGVQVIRPGSRHHLGFMEAEASIGFADAGVAETGSILYITRYVWEEAAIFSPETHVSLLSSKDIHPGLEDLADKLHNALSRGLSAYLITGPSSTGDIEGEIIIGVHGSRVLHVAIYGGEE